MCDFKTNNFWIGVHFTIVEKDFRDYIIACVIIIVNITDCNSKANNHWQ